MLPEKERKLNVTSMNRRAVCRRCFVVMSDIEPSCGGGEFCHPTTFKKTGKPNPCKNAGGTFFLDTGSDEIEPFASKKERRVAKQVGSKIGQRWGDK